jgi:hypothetical protein
LIGGCDLDLMTVRQSQVSRRDFFNSPNTHLAAVKKDQGERNTNKKGFDNSGFGAVGRHDFPATMTWNIRSKEVPIYMLPRDAFFL